MVGKSRILIALGLLAVLGACGQEKKAEIGVVLPLTGPWSIYGETIRKGVELAADHVQAEAKQERSKLDLVLTIKDSESQPEHAAQLLRQLYQNGAIAAIGGVTSAEALPMTRVADDAQRVLLSPSASSPDLSGASRYFYRLFPSDFHEGNKMGSFAALKLDLKNVVILAANNPFARGISRVFRHEFERYDGKVLDEVVYPDDTTDFSSFLDQALKSNPQAVFLADFAEPVEKILVALEKRGYQGKRLTTSAFATQSLIDQAGAAAEGVILSQTVFNPESDDPRVKHFVEAYRKKYGEQPGLFAAYGYDSLLVLAKALESEGTSIPSELWKGLRGLTSFQGITGPVQFDQSGDNARFPRVYIIRSGKLEDYESYLEQRKREIQERRRQLFQDLERLRGGEEGKGGGAGG